MEKLDTTSNFRPSQLHRCPVSWCQGWSSRPKCVEIFGTLTWATRFRRGWYHFPPWATKGQVRTFDDTRRTIPLKTGGSFRCQSQIYKTRHQVLCLQTFIRYLILWRWKVRFGNTNNKDSSGLSNSSNVFKQTFVCISWTALPATHLKGE